MRNWAALLTGAAVLITVGGLTPDAEAQSVFQKLFGFGNPAVSVPVSPQPYRQIVPSRRFQNRVPIHAPPPPPPAAEDDIGPPDSGGPYKTLCVRACDGFYFPLRYNARHENFASDAKSCKNACGTEARLFYYPVNGPDGPDEWSISPVANTAKFRTPLPIVKRPCKAARANPCRGPPPNKRATKRTLIRRRSNSPRMTLSLRRGRRQKPRLRQERRQLWNRRRLPRPRPAIRRRTPAPQHRFRKKFSGLCAGGSDPSCSAFNTFICPSNPLRNGRCHPCLAEVHRSRCGQRHRNSRLPRPYQLAALSSLT